MKESRTIKRKYLSVRLVVATPMEQMYGDLDIRGVMLDSVDNIIGR